MSVRRISRPHATLALVPILLLMLLHIHQVRTSNADSAEPGRENTLPEQVRDLTLYPRGAVAFQDRPIHADTLGVILAVITAYSSLSDWKLIAIREKENRIALLEAMQEAYKRMGRDSWAATMERWKSASVLLAFAAPKSFEEFGGVPRETVRRLAILEMGMGVQSLALVARAHGLETHWIASALLVDETIERELKIPRGYDLAFFGMVGFPSEEVTQEFAALEDVLFMEEWGKQR